MNVQICICLILSDILDAADFWYIYCLFVFSKNEQNKVIMKKVLVTLVLAMTLSVSVSFAQAVLVEAPVVEKPQQSKKLVFSEIYVNDLPGAVMDRLALEGAMIKEAFMAYGIDGSRIYKVNVLTSDAHEQTLFLGEDGKLLK